MRLAQLTTLTLIVHDSAGAPITRPLDIDATAGSGSNDGIGVTGPNAAGAYTLTHVDANTTIYVRDDLDGDPVYASWGTGNPPNFIADSAAPQSKTITLPAWSGIRARAITPDGTPLRAVRWNIFAQDAGGAWDHGIQAGPLLTDADGRMSWAVPHGANYKLCFYDDDYSFNTRSQRYADTCWVNSSTLQDATVWTPTTANLVLNADVTMKPDGLALTVGHPWVDGSAVVGKTLTVRPGVWEPSGVALSYQWVAYNSAGDRTPIAGATGTTFTPSAADTGKRIAVEVTGTKAGYHTAVAGASVGVVGGTTPTMTGELKITGTPLPGNKLTAVTGTFVPADTYASLNWYVNGRPADDSLVDGNNLTITPAMAGATVEVDMSAYRWSETPGVCCTNTLYASDQVTIGGGVTGAKPTVTGNAVVGSTLTVNDGSWGPSGVSLARQWLRDGTAISGAIAQTYQLAEADRGKTISVRVTGTLAGGYPPVSQTSAATAAVQGVLTSGTPTISGTPTVGQTLTASPGTWSPTPGFTYQWSAGGTAISGATSSTFVPTAAQVGKTITVTVTGTLSGYVPASKTSAATAAVQGVLTASTPTISGDAVVGKSLTANAGAWSPSGVSLSYQWLADGETITGATTATFEPTKAEADKKITVKVTGTLPDYVTASKTSAPTDAVLDVFVDPPTPTVTGTGTVGQELKAEAGEWGAGAVLDYEWRRDGTAIPGATDATYVPIDADRGHEISVRVVATKDGYQQAERISETIVIPGAFTSAPTPTIAGTPVVGRTLTAKPGAWSPAPALTYQWFRSGTAIPGATAATYKLVTADAGRTITVRVTATRSGLETASTTSRPTAAVARTFAKSPKPRIAGKAKVGKKLAAKVGTWSPRPTVKYQWLRNGKVIKGATHATYKLKKADKGKRITVRVTGSRAGYVTVVKTSAATKKIAR